MSKRKQNGEVFYKAKKKDGTHLAPSHDTPGTYRGSLLDNETNRVVGQAEWEEVDESEFEDDDSYDNQDYQQEREWSPEERMQAELLRQTILAGAAYVLTDVAPQVKRWLQNKALPTLKERWKIFTDKRKDKQLPKGK